jgi:hypothetical protein
MNPETGYLNQMRLRAGNNLPPDFAREVIRDAQVRGRRSQRNRLTAVTAMVCIALVLAVHWMMTARSNRKNLELWSKAAGQIAVLDQTI